MVNYLMGRYTVGLRQACRCVRMTRSMYYYRSRMDPQTALRQRMREIAHARVRFGYRRVYIMLRREGWDVGKDRFYRVYREENLGLRRKRSWRHVSAVHRLERLPASRANEVWGMDFVADQLADGRKIRTLTIVDLFTGRFRDECLNAHWFESIDDASEKIDAWRWDYNENRPHRSL
jgi:putative transposase